MSKTPNQSVNNEWKKQKQWFEYSYMHMMHGGFLSELEEKCIKSQTNKKKGVSRPHKYSNK